MYRRVFMAAILVVALGLSACGQPNTGASASQTQQAGQQILSERTTAGPVAGNAGQMPQDAPVIGTIDRVEGNKLIVKAPFNGSSTTVQLGSDTKIKKHAPGQISDINVGDAFTAYGTRKGDTFDPISIAIGSIIAGAPIMFNNPGGAPAGSDVTGNIAIPAPDAGGLAAGGPGAAGMSEPLAGTVERIEGNTIVVKDLDGKSITMVVTSQARINKLVDAQLGELQAGKLIMADVLRNGQLIQATQVQILPDPQT